MTFSSPNTPVHHIALRSSPVTDDRHDFRLLEQAFKMLPDVVMIYDVDSQQTIYSNRTFGSVLGYDDDAAVDVRMLHPADVVRVNAQFQDALLLSDEDTGNITYRLRDVYGEWRWFAERQVIFKRHVDGSVAQILKSARYEKKPPINTAYPAHTDLLRRIADYNLPNLAILLFDHDLRHTVATGMLLRRLGFTSTEIEGHTLRELVEPHIVEWLEPVYQSALGGADIHFDRTVSDTTYKIHCSPVWNERGEITAGMVLLEDITAEAATDKMLFDLEVEREHSRLLSQIISTISHEFRTPMTIINTSLYLVKKTNDPVKQGERLQIIERQVAQLARLVEQMGLLLRVENIRTIPAVSSVSLNTVLTDLEGELAPLLAKKELALELILDDNLPNIDVDPALLLVALQNVLDNAINYSDAGTITATTSTEGDTVILTVKDTGIGIHPEDLPHIFERFYKAESNKRRDVIAAGLGLTITQRIMELSGGRVEVETALGAGSTFRLVWPVGK